MQCRKKENQFTVFTEIVLPSEFCERCSSYSCGKKHEAIPCLHWPEDIWSQVVDQATC